MALNLLKPGGAHRGPFTSPATTCAGHDELQPPLASPPRCATTTPMSLRAIPLETKITISYGCIYDQRPHARSGDVLFHRPRGAVPFESNLKTGVKDDQTLCHQAFGAVITR